MGLRRYGIDRLIGRLRSRWLLIDVLGLRRSRQLLMKRLRIRHRRLLIGLSRLRRSRWLLINRLRIGN